MQQVVESPIKRIPKWFLSEDPTKLTNSFEFGPAWWIHLPMKIFGLFWGFRLGNLGFFAAANPGLENGGLYDYSKNDGLDRFDPVNRPISILVSFPFDHSEIVAKMEAEGINFPLVAKPDFGERGREVEFLENEEALQEYFADKKDGKYIIQEMLKEGLEFGVFYSKNPESGQSQITSLTLKIPIQVVGDGKNTVRNLIWNHPRAVRYLDEINCSDFDYVPGKGETVKLSRKGNHCKGAVFLDCKEYIDDDLVKVFGKICSPVDGFYYGRLDVKVNRFEELWDSQKIKLIEVNGCNSEPIHIYSPGNTYLEAIKSVGYHFSIMAKIARINLKAKKFKPNLSILWANYLNFRKSRKV
jgi:hypothetical protein